MSLEEGLLSGLSWKMSWDKDIEGLRYREERERRAKIDAANKAKMFADDFQYNNAMNVFDNPRVKEFSSAKIKEIGQFVNQNPDWETNMQKRAQYSQMIHDLKDNPELNRGLASDEGKKSFMKDLAEKKKTPEFDEDAYNEVSKQWDNYQKYGNQFVTSADPNELQKAGGYKEFNYNQPKDKLDFAKRAEELVKGLGKVKTVGANGTTYEYTPQENAETAAFSLYNQNPNQAEREAKALGFNNGKDYVKKLFTDRLGTAEGRGFAPQRESEWQYKARTGAIPEKDKTNVTSTVTDRGHDIILARNNENNEKMLTPITLDNNETVNVNQVHFHKDNSGNIRAYATVPLTKDEQTENTRTIADNVKYGEDKPLPFQERVIGISKAQANEVIHGNYKGIDNVEDLYKQKYNEAQVNFQHNDYKSKKSTESKAEYTPQQETGISRVMSHNNMSREEAIKALVSAGKLK